MGSSSSICNSFTSYQRQAPGGGEPPGACSCLPELGTGQRPLALNRRVDVILKEADLSLGLMQLEVHLVDPGLHGGFLLVDLVRGEIDDAQQARLDAGGVVHLARLAPSQRRYDHDGDEKDDDQQKENRELFGADHRNTSS